MSEIDTDTILKIWDRLDLILTKSICYLKIDVLSRSMQNS